MGDISLGAMAARRARQNIRLVFQRNMDGAPVASTPPSVARPMAEPRLVSEASTYALDHPCLCGHIATWHWLADEPQHCIGKDCIGKDCPCPRFRPRRKK